MPDVKRLAGFIANDLLGRPFRMGADGPNEYDCYGAAKAVLARGFDITLPPMKRDEETHTPKELAKRLMDPTIRSEWIEITRNGHSSHDLGKSGDIMVMGNIDGRSYHLGVRLQFGAQHVVVHADERNGIVVDDVITLPFKGYNKIRYFRHKSRIGR